MAISLSKDPQTPTEYFGSEKPACFDGSASHANENINKGQVLSSRAVTPTHSITSEAYVTE